MAWDFSGSQAERNVAARPATRASKAPNVSKQQRLFEEAVQLFSRHGYASTSIPPVADAVGVLPGSLYAHIAGRRYNVVAANVDLARVAFQHGAISSQPIGSASSVSGAPTSNVFAALSI